jgi:hypothetical protein
LQPIGRGNALRRGTPDLLQETAGMEFGLAQLRTLLSDRLEARGIEKCLVPGLQRLMASAFAAEKHLNRQVLSRRLGFLGWPDFEVDEHTFQLAKACFEAEAAKLKPLEKFLKSA